MSSVQLIRLSSQHLEKTMHWRTSFEVTKYLYTDPKLTIDDQIAWFERICTDPSVMYWIINVDQNDIGVLNLYDIDRQNSRCAWAYYIGETGYRGRGLGRILECNIYDYVFGKLNLNKLWCEVLSNNEKVVEIHKKFGSEIEGCFTDHIIKKGQILDVIRMGITKKKWISLREQFKYEPIEIDTIFNYSNNSIPTANFQIGDRAFSTKRITESDLIAFANIAGDKNPIHLDLQFARKTIFGKQIAQGMLLGSLISGVLGTKLPGPSSVYIKQELNFIKPVYINDYVTAGVEITDISLKKNKVYISLNTWCANQSNEIVCDGQALMLHGDCR